MISTKINKRKIRAAIRQCNQRMVSGHQKMELRAIVSIGNIGANYPGFIQDTSILISKLANTEIQLKDKRTILSRMKNFSIYVNKHDKKYPFHERLMFLKKRLIMQSLIRIYRAYPYDDKNSFDLIMKLIPTPVIREAVICLSFLSMKNDQYLMEFKMRAMESKDNEQFIQFLHGLGTIGEKYPEKISDILPQILSIVESPDVQRNILKSIDRFFLRIGSKHPIFICDYITIASDMRSPSYQTWMVGIISKLAQFDRDNVEKYLDLTLGCTDAAQFALSHAFARVALVDPSLVQDAMDILVHFGNEYKGIIRTILKRDKMLIWDHLKWKISEEGFTEIIAAMNAPFFVRYHESINYNLNFYYIIALIKLQSLDGFDKVRIQRNLERLSLCEDYYDSPAQALNLELITKYDSLFNDRIPSFIKYPENPYNPYLLRGMARVFIKSRDKIERDRLLTDIIHNNGYSNSWIHFFLNTIRDEGKDMDQEGRMLLIEKIFSISNEDFRRLSSFTANLYALIELFPDMKTELSILFERNIEILTRDDYYSMLYLLAGCKLADGGNDEFAKTIVKLAVSYLDHYNYKKHENAEKSLKVLLSNNREYLDYARFVIEYSKNKLIKHRGLRIVKNLEKNPEKRIIKIILDDAPLEPSYSDLF